MRKIRKFFKLPFATKFMLLEATVLLAVAWFTVRVIPFKYWARYLGAINLETSNEISEEMILTANRVRWAVRVMNKHLFWHSTCLMEATAGKIMLNRRGISNTMYVGVKKKHEDGPLEIEAHAWLRTGEIIVTGGPIHRSFTTLSCFGTEIS